MTHAVDSTKPDNLIKMANQIGSFFETMPDQQQAQADMAKHLKSFWALRMRRALFEYLDQHGGTELKAFVLETLHARREAIL